MTIESTATAGPIAASPLFDDLLFEGSGSVLILGGLGLLVFAFLTWRRSTASGDRQEETVPSAGPAARREGIVPSADSGDRREGADPSAVFGDRHERVVPSALSGDRHQRIVLATVGGFAALAFGGFVLSAAGTEVVDTTVTRIEVSYESKAGPAHAFYGTDGRRVDTPSHTVAALKKGRRVRCRIHRSALVDIRLGECVLDPEPEYVVVDPAERDLLEALRTNQTEGAGTAYRDLFRRAKREYRQDLG